MARKSRRLPDLSPAQREIMQIVWDQGEVAASDVRRLLSRGLARNTVRTLLERMEEKGWLTHRQEGRTHLYSAARPRQATAGQKAWEVVDTVCGGSPEALVTALLDYRGLTEGELHRIREILDEAKARSARGEPRKS